MEDSKQQGFASPSISLPKDVKQVVGVPGASRQQQVYLTGSQLEQNRNNFGVEGFNQFGKTVNQDSNQQNLHLASSPSLISRARKPRRNRVDSPAPISKSTVGRSNPSVPCKASNIKKNITEHQGLGQATSKHRKRSIGANAASSKNNSVKNLENSRVFVAPEQRKRQKYERQKERRTALNDAMDELHRVLGISQDTKTDRLFLIHVAIDTVKMLRGQVHDLSAKSLPRNRAGGNRELRKQCSRDSQDTSDGQVGGGTDSSRQVQETSVATIAPSLAIPLEYPHDPHNLDNPAIAREMAFHHNFNENGDSSRPRISSMDVITSMIPVASSPEKSVVSSSQRRTAPSLKNPLPSTPASLNTKSSFVAQDNVPFPARSSLMLPANSVMNHSAEWPSPSESPACSSSISGDGSRVYQPLHRAVPPLSRSPIHRKMDLVQLTCDGMGADMSAKWSRGLEETRVASESTSDQNNASVSEGAKEDSQERIWRWNDSQIPEPTSFDLNCKFDPLQDVWQTDK